jgi:hypothetical protein
MTNNPWKENFSKAAKYAVYLKPSISCVGTFVMALALCELGRFVGVVDRSDWNSIIHYTFLGTILIYVLTVSAKVDLLKRTVDQNARYCDTKMLWLDKTNEVASDKRTDK